ncbi:MAG: hypothetical protein BMS9Abin37_1934 [Acidobacteriota bacterium]|nr:MAG: hypothetical protein BMS9Abin37_1934 [Acidobacteriota bacterium]
MIQEVEDWSADDGFIATLSSPVLESETRSERWVDGKNFEIVAPPRCIIFDSLSETILLYTNVLASICTRSTQSLNQHIADLMSVVPQVERVYSKYDGNTFYTWIVIEERDRDVQRAIYAIEKEIIGRFSEMCFDFYIIYRSGADIDSLVSDVELVYDREASK